MIAVAAARIAVDALARSWRVRVSGANEQARLRRQEPVIFTVWHGGLLPAMCQHRREGITLLVSAHGDGEYLAQAAERWGFRTIRGSSTRGSIAGFKGLVRALREGHDVAVTPDGPRGPAGAVKPGAVALAQLTGAPIIPMGTAATPAWTAGSWDGFMMPKPRARVRVAYGRALRVLPGASARTGGVAALRDALDRARDEAACSL